MAFVVSLVGFRPGPRYPPHDEPWVEARIEESTEPTGPWTERETQALSPVDPDPSSPTYRNFTINTATLEEGWYRVIFLDADGNTESSQAIYSSTLAPTAADIRLWSQVDFDALGYEGNPDPLQRDVTGATTWVQNVTGLKFGADLDADLVQPMQDAVRMAVEFGAFRADPDHIEGLIDFDTVKEFSAGRYSETRRGLGSSVLVLHPWPALNSILLFLRNQGGGSEDDVPGVAGSPPDWERQRYIMDAPLRNVDPFDMRNGGVRFWMPWRRV